jgi:hypothetical protein
MAASTSLYVFTYAAALFFTRTSMTGLLQTTFYFGWAGRRWVHTAPAQAARSWVSRHGVSS